MENLDNQPTENQPSEPENKNEKKMEDFLNKLKKPDDQEITLSSKKNWFYVGLIIAVLNPIFAGLIIGVFYLSEKELRREGRIILLLAIIFGFIHTYAVMQILPYLDQGMI